MAMDIQKALKLGQFVSAAYSPVSTNPVKYAPPFNYQVVQVLYGNDLATDVNVVKAMVPFGFIAQSPPPAATDFVVAIRGTESIWEWMQDARFLMVPCPFADGAGKTEDGFTDVYMSMNINLGGGPRVVDALRALLAAVPNATLNITGHSLGSALATLLALDVVENNAFATPSVITLASPTVGDTQFARTYNAEVPETWRVANWMDLVPKLPPSNWGYDHVDHLFQVNSLGKAKANPYCAHILSTYLFLISQIAGVGGFALDPACAGWGL
jgi:hypothetical protein